MDEKKSAKWQRPQLGDVIVNLSSSQSPSYGNASRWRSHERNLQYLASVIDYSLPFKGK